jgi:hypothetical protein
MTLNQSVAGKFSNRVLAEACELAGKCRFSERRGDAHEGNLLSIMVDPRPEASGRTLSARVVCHVFGHRRVNWSGCILSVREENSGRRPAAFAFLHPGGHAVFERLPFGNYRLSLQPYGQDIWTDSRQLPTAEQIEQQDWLQPEIVCSALADRAAQAAEAKTAGVEAVAILGAFAGSSEKMAKPALGACLAIFSNIFLPQDLRFSASKFITSKKAAFLADTDLSMFSSNFRRFPLPPHRLHPPGRLETKLYKTFGTILSKRPSIGKDEKALLEDLVVLSKRYGVSLRPVVLPTSGWLRTKGTIGSPPNEGLLLVLAKSGGSSVRKVLVEILKTQPRSDGLMDRLRKSTS